MPSDLRRQPRETVALPVRTSDGVSGISRDISAGGLYFVAPVSLQAGAAITVEIDLTTPLGPLRMIGHGHVVRIDAHADRHGVAVQFARTELRRIASPNPNTQP